MNYEETVQYLYNCAPVFEHVGASAYKEGLGNTVALDKHFGSPHHNFKTIHVGGTNGKGSCSHTIAAILQSAGLKVGLYTSPHLADFRERIRINGEMIGKEEVIRFVEEERHFFEPLHPSFFELTTAMAFRHFARHKVDIAVIEVGLGGRLDCTNIITPLASVITNISLDHTQFLGNTTAKIASEKAGIIKQHVPVIIGETTPDTHPVFQRKALEMNAPIVFTEEKGEVLAYEQSEQDGKTGIKYKTRSFGDIFGELGGYCQPKNTNTILTTLRTIGFTDRKAIRQGFADVCKLTGLMGRWQKLQTNPLVICDTGHNSGGWKYLASQIKSIECDKLRIVFGMVDDKDIDSVMDMLPTNAIYYFTQASTKRAIPSETVARIAKRHNLNGKTFTTVKQAYNAALADSGNKDFVFVGGSSYIVADLTVCI